MRRREPGRLNFLVATAGDYLRAAAAKILSASNVWAAAAPVTLVDAATIALDMSTFVDAVVTIGGNRALGNPTNAKPGQKGTLYVVEDGTGGRTLSFGSNFKFPGGQTPSIDTTASKVNVFGYSVRNSSEVVLAYLGSY